jgi:hypothetical protein
MIEMWMERPRTRTPIRDAVRRASCVDSHAHSIHPHAAAKSTVYYASNLWVHKWTRKSCA